MQGSFMVKTCVWSVGSCAKDLGISLMVTSLPSTLHWAKEVVVKMWDMYGLVNHDVIDLASQRVIIGKRTTNLKF